MCDKCRENPENRNTRYCDDWWEDTSHGGYAGDREEKEKRRDPTYIPTWGEYFDD